MKEQVLGGEVLSTLMCQAEATVNSWPLTNNSSDPQEPEPLTPNHLLTMRSSLQIMGEMDKKDLYCKRRVRQGL